MRFCAVGSGVTCSDCLRVVFDHFQRVVGGELAEGLAPAHAAVEVNRHDCAGEGCDIFSEGIGVEVQGDVRRVGEHRFQSAFRNCENRGDIGVGGHNDFIAGRECSRFDIPADNETQSVKTVADADGMAHAGGIGEPLFEFGDLGAAYVASGADHGRYSSPDVGHERPVDFGQL